MPQTQAVAGLRFSGQVLDPIDTAAGAVKHPVLLAPNTVFALGTLLASAGSAVNDVQTLTVTGTPTGGTLAISGTHPTQGVPFTVTLAFNSTVVQTQAAVDAVLGSRLLTVGGGTLPGSTQTFTGVNGAAGMPIPVMTVSVALLTGGTPAASFAHTTLGVATGTYAPYASGLITPPTTAPTLTAGGSDGTFGVGTYAVEYTYVTANGESTPSAAAPITLTAAQHIAITSITGIPTGVTSVNAYVNGALSANQAVTSGATGGFNLTGFAATGGSPPTINSATVGSLTAWKCILRYACATDAAGNIGMGATSTSAIAGQWGETRQYVDAWFGGQFATSKLVGLDAYALTQLGRLRSGTISNGVLQF